MRLINLSLVSLAVLWSGIGFAKLKIYRCQSESGQIVIQDRVCRITDLLNDSADTKNTVKKQKPPSRQNHSHRNTFVATAEQKKPKQAQQFLNRVNQQKWHKSYWSKDFGWQLVLAIDALPKTKNVEANMVVNYYANTMRYFGQDAFAQALRFYHDIRNNNQLQDSQFVSHPDYKVFSISYRSKGERSYTEYYVHKNRPELWVITVNSPPQSWSLVWPDFVQLKSVL